MLAMLRAVALLGGCVLLGCPGKAISIGGDGGSPVPDGGSASDSGAADSGTSPDAGTPPDAGGKDGGRWFYDGGPPDLTCLTDAGLTAVEQQLVNLSADTWLTVPNTAFGPFCTTHLDAGVYSSGCVNEVNAWSGGAFDDGNRQMVIWGGGHVDYWGNEIYGLDIATLTWSVLHAATPVDMNQISVDPYFDGNPSSRHTYGGLAYLSDIRQFFAYGGSRAGNGGSLSTTWFFDLQAHTWAQQANSVSASAGNFFMGSAYDPVTRTVYVRDEDEIASYDVVQNKWTQLVNYTFAPYWPTYQSYNYRSAVIAPSQRLFIAAGGTLADGGLDIIAYDLDAGAEVTARFGWSGNPAAAMTAGAGMDIAPRANAIVAWSGGAPSIFDLGSRTWTTGSAVGAPASQVTDGTYGRFRYIAYLNVFILVNDPAEDVHFYKLTPGCGP
jgi:hypothetical protein